jgi:hypothetical protein
MAEYLARVTWDNVSKYREELREGATSGGESQRLPLTDQYGSNQSILDKLRFGDGLWLFTAPVFGHGSSRRTLPPSVLGRISITHKWNPGTSRIEPAPGAPSAITPACNIHRLMVTKDFQYWCCGVPGHALPIHNAFALFRDLTFEGRVERVSPNCKGCNQAYVPGKGPFGHLMQHFESIC